MSQSVLVVFGTRPEAIKMLPVVDALRATPGINVDVCVTAQHRDLLDTMLALFDVVPDFDLDVMTKAQGLTEVTQAVLGGVSQILSDHSYDWLLVHGDTTTTFAAALAGFYAKVPVAHVEAGLRSGDLSQPWPEEANRRFTDVMSTLYFAPTVSARQNLEREHVPSEAIVVTGNTAIDALTQTLERLKRRPELTARLNEHFAYLEGDRPIVLVTAHRRESFGPKFVGLCEAVRDLALHHGATVVYPVHPNPNVRKVAEEVLGSTAHVYLIEPLDYVAFVDLMRRSDVILTDSGGIQEEAPTLGKPVFVLRDVTERPEAVQAGTAKLVGTDAKTILSAISAVLTDRAAYERMSVVHNPFGDGKSAQRIAQTLATGTTTAFTGNGPVDKILINFNRKA